MEKVQKYAHIVKNCPEVIDFFIYFSRFEYAMKRTSGMWETRISGGVEASWKGFGKTFKEGLLNFPEVLVSIEYLLAYPPKRFSDDGSWKSHNWASEPDYKRLFLAITAIRNNLFHGDKFDVVTEVGEQERDYELIRHSLAVLKAWTSLPRINGFF